MVSKPHEINVVKLTRALFHNRWVPSSAAVGGMSLCVEEPCQGALSAHRACRGRLVSPNLPIFGAPTKHRMDPNVSFRASEAGMRRTHARYPNGFERSI